MDSRIDIIGTIGCAPSLLEQKWQKNVKIAAEFVNCAFRLRHGNCPFLRHGLLLISLSLVTERRTDAAHFPTTVAWMTRNVRSPRPP